MPLTIKEIEAAKPNPERDYKMADGDGMFLFVTKAGGKHWRLKYRFLGKEKLFAIGKYPIVGLAEAREKRFELKRMLAAGIDPMTHKQEIRQQAIEERDNTFERIARRWHENKKAGWSVGYAHDVIRHLEIDAFPAIGKKPITAVTTKDIIAILQDMENRGVGELARRLKQTISEVLRYAVVHQHITVNPASNFHSKDVLRRIEKKHFAAIESREIPQLLLAGIGMRTCFDIASRSSGINNEFSFAEKLEALAAGGHIDEKDKTHLEILIDAGNASAHRGWSPTPEELDAIMAVLEHFIHKTIVVPHTKSKLDEKLGKVKDSIPARKATNTA